MVLVFDVGGTNTRLALADEGKLQEIVRLPTDATAAGFAKFLGHLQEIAQGQHIKAVAGGMPGQFKGEDKELVLASNLGEWKGQRVASSVRELLDCPVFVANDMEMCGLGEAHDGAGTAEGVMAYFTVSTGVNGVRIVNGEVDQTIARYELGHQIINHAGGKARSLEQLVGGAALEKRLGITPKEVKDQNVWRGLESYLAAGLYNAVLYWHPSRIVLGGSMMRDLKTTNVAAALAQMSQVYDEWPEIVAAKLGDEGGLRGALSRLDSLGFS